MNQRIGLLLYVLQYVAHSHDSSTPRMDMPDAHDVA